MCSNKLLKHEWRDIESGGLQEFAFRLISCDVRGGQSDGTETGRLMIRGLSNKYLVDEKLCITNKCSSFYFEMFKKLIRLL